MPRAQEIETAVIGAGQAGLAMSRCLAELGCEHIVLERGRVAERWRTERWDSFALQGPNWTLQLPGCHYEGPDPDGFTRRDDLVRWLDDYALRNRAPLRCGVTVSSLQAETGTDRWLVRTDPATFPARNVVVATGAFELPYIPSGAEMLPPEIVQVAAVRYQRPSQFPPGAVLVVGSGSSGSQITEDLLAAGRTVFLSIGRHDRVPRRYRGQDVVWWLTELGEFDRTNKTIDATRVKTRRGTGPGLLLTGVGGGHTLDLRQHALDGAVLLGHLVAIDGPTMTFAPDVERVLAQGDLMFERFVATVDHHVRRLGLEVPEEEIVTQAPGYAPIDSLGTLDLRRTGIAAVVWATGLSRDYPWLHVPVLDGERRPVHTRGVTAFPGLFFLGLTWQSRLLSPFINGVGADAEYLADRIMERLAGRILVERAGARA